MISIRLPSPGSSMLKQLHPNDFLIMPRIEPHGPVIAAVTYLACKSLADVISSEKLTRGDAMEFKFVRAAVPW